MITITNGSLTLVVTKGTYKQAFKSLGWQIKEMDKKQEIIPEQIVPDKVEITKDVEQEIVETETNVEEEVENIELEDIEEKPLSEMTPEEVREYATTLGIDFTGVVKTKTIRQMIRDKIS